LVYNESLFMDHVMNYNKFNGNEVRYSVKNKNQIWRYGEPLSAKVARSQPVDFPAEFRGLVFGPG